MSKFLDQAAEYIRENNIGVFRIAEYKDGVAEDVTIVGCPACHNSYSVAKAFVVAGIGMLVDRGMMKTSDTIAEIFPEEVAAVEEEKEESAPEEPMQEEPVQEESAAEIAAKGVKA